MPILWLQAAPQYVQWSSPTSAATATYFQVAQTAATTASTCYPINAVPWFTLAGNERALYAQQQAYNNAMGAQQAAYERYEFGLQRPSGLGQLFPQGGLAAIAAPALITHQEQARRDEELYRRALAECNEQEATRLRLLIEAREQNEAERRRLLQQAQELQQEQQRQRQAVSTRAQELLLQHLSPEQRDTFTRNGWFIVEGGKSKIRYRINGRSYAGNIEVLHGDNRVIHRLCCHADSHIPLGDQLLSQKIMLELAENDFLRIANRHAA